LKQNALLDQSMESLVN